MDGKWRYDVFLSFRGGDTRKNFTDHLYHGLVDAGINAFRDDDELRRGEDISSSLIQAIRSSRISVIVFSEDYAGSRWCLQELAEIMECRRNSGQMVFPIFCGVEPSDVRHQKGSYARAFVKHEKRIMSEEGTAALAGWRDALTQAASLSGWDLKNSADGYEAKIVKDIVSKVWNELKHDHLNVAKHPVGLASRLEELNELIHLGSDSVRFVGICGIGGIGKTTLAKAVYNQFFHTFEGKSFIVDVRENSGRPEGLLQLQEQLLCDVLRLENIELKNIHRGINVVREKLCSRRVLIVLDDLNHLDQLRTLAGGSEWFGSGSVIIITTRHLDLLKEVEADLYMARELDEEESLQLFSLHAFKSLHPEDEYVDLSKAIISHSKGLPLALEVLGSFLRDRSPKIWKEALNKLKLIPHSDIQAQLRISYDSLGDDTEKALFLDIACFFVGWDKDYVVKILNGCGLFAEIGMVVLCERCLLWSDDRGKLMMHDLIQDMGREIVREVSPNNPGRRSRLWFYEDTFSTLKDQKGTEVVEGIVLDSPALDGLTVSAEAFAGMSRLRLLQLNSVNVCGSYGLISKELKWLQWTRFSLNSVPNDFYMANLVTLEMQWSNLRKVWKDNKLLGSLKVLNLSHSHFLTKTPNFLKLPNLEELILSYCIELVDIHQSIGNLEKLLLVDLKDCKKLKQLPSSICRVRSLMILNVSGCSNMENLPEDIGDLMSLKELLADGTAITQVPSSIRLLKNLKILSFGGCKASNSHSICSLLWSFVTATKVPRSNNMLMTSLASLTSLESLCLRDCNLSDNSIPQGIGSLPFLRDLDLSKNNFSHLPDSISCLPNLYKLILDDCVMLQWLSKMPPRLGELRASHCPRLERIISVLDVGTLVLDDCPRLTEISGLDKQAVADIRLKGCTSLSPKLRHFLLENQFGDMGSQIWLPGNEIPDWLSYQGAGPSLSLILPRTQFGKLKDLLTVCVVYEAKGESNAYPRFIALDIYTRIGKSKLCCCSSYAYVPVTSEDHIWVYRGTLGINDKIGDEDIEVEVTTETDGGAMVKRLGIHLGKHYGSGNSSLSLGYKEVGTSIQLIGNKEIDITDSGICQAEAKSDRDICDTEDCHGYGSPQENRPPKRMRLEPIEGDDLDEK